jgi:hypothetical protein
MSAKRHVSLGLLVAAVACLPKPDAPPLGPDGRGGSGGMTGTAGAASGSGGSSVGGSSSSMAGASGSNAAGTVGTSGTAGGNVGAGGLAFTMDVCGAMPAGDVAFSVASGTFQNSVTVELRSLTAGAEIRYTTDRSTPTSSSMLYAGQALTFSATTVLSAQAFVQGAPTSPPSTAVYIARSFEQTHDLPVVVLDSFGRALPAAGSAAADEYTDVALMILEPSGGTVALSTTPAMATGAGFHVRGQTSAMYDKKPFKLELRNPGGGDRDCPVLGMPAESDWVLHSPYPDKALIRNAFTYSLGRDIGMAAPRGVLVEVYVNTASRPLGSADYQGVYLLVESIKNQKNRLDLNQLKTADVSAALLSGGYIFKFEWQVSDIKQKLLCPSGQQNCWNWLEVADPDPWAPQQQDYLAQYLSSFVTALHSSSPSDTTSGYPAFIDTSSFANQVIVHELTRNLDAYARSQYFYKDRDAKVFAGPLWDYDLIAGVGFSSGSGSNLATSGWQSDSVASRLATTADWFPRLLADAAFKAQVIARWKELRQGQLSDAQIRARISQWTSGLKAGAERNFQRWKILTTARIGLFTTPTASTWEAQVTSMQDWLIARAAWLDDMWR